MRCIAITKAYYTWQLQKVPGITIKGKAVPLQAWSGPEGSRKLRFPDFIDNGTGWW